MVLSTFLFFFFLVFLLTTPLTSLYFSKKSNTKS
uniref:Uncharacterized protein n=1 Tax=Siphoviridae sp. ctHip2 TaxID=2827830 RepID=A0A8S5RV59_9CAUD|nr:MAG TPA: hypothetical protein [Siphoviridae sp. ctHip2]